MRSKKKCKEVREPHILLHATGLALCRHTSLKWRKPELVFPGTDLRDDDWTLLDATGDRMAHLFNTGVDDLIGAWRWRVWLDHKMHEGSVRTGTDPRERCERLLVEFQHAQMMQQ
ncbi:MAG: hypothetical protein ACKOEW_04160 [Methylocystis sp.]